MKFSTFCGAVLLPFAATVGAIDLKTDDEASIMAAAKQYAYGLMSCYVNNAGGTADQDIGIFPKPLYWWEAGAAWGGMIEYTQLTGDASHQKTLQQALTANYGPNNDILLSWRKSEEGNDDQAFWGFTVMSAAEYGFAESGSAPATYLQVAENTFNNIISRWDTTSCNGGLKWQIYPENSYGYDYKNSISNGATFALAARLARYTGNQTYADWAVKIWDWQKAVGLMSDDYAVYDGTNDKKNCTDQDHNEWTYNLGSYLHGASVMYNYTNGDATWKTHVSGLLEHAAVFFKPYDNATDIMYEKVCETFDKCNNDQLSFKAYLSRFLSKAAIMAPFTKEKVTAWLTASAAAAAKSCSGNGTSACGNKWYMGAWDGTSGVGQQLSALEVTQALLTLKNNVAPGTGDSKPSPSSSSAPFVSSTSSVGASSSASASSSQQATSAPISSSVSSVVSSAVSSAGSATSSAIITTAAPSSKAATSSSSAAAVAGSSQAGGNFAEEPTGTASTSCTPTSTTTKYVAPSSTVYTPPTVPAVPYPTTTHSANATVSAPPAANTTGPEQFPGAASSNRVAAYTFVVAALVVAVCGML